MVATAMMAVVMMVRRSPPFHSCHHHQQIWQLSYPLHLLELIPVVAGGTAAAVVVQLQRFGHRHLLPQHVLCAWQVAPWLEGMCPTWRSWTRHL